MPDRDVLPLRIPRHWRGCARLWRDEGLTPAVVDAARRALAHSLRSHDQVTSEAERELGSRARADAHAHEELCDLVLAKALFAPMRPTRLDRVGYPELEAQEAALRRRLAQDRALYAQQLALGKVVRARPIRRPRMSEVLGQLVEVHL